MLSTILLTSKIDNVHNQALENYKISKFKVFLIKKTHLINLKKNTNN